MEGRKSFYITTPIYYVNDRPHIGHAYTTLACDVLARFKRLDGFDVKFLTGTDEHGQKVEKSARAVSLTPRVFTDQVSQNFYDLMQLMGFSNDDFIRTTEPRHLRSCQALWNELVRRDQIYLGCYAGWYSVRDEAFWREDELKDGPGGIPLAPTGAAVEWVEEPSYFFRLSHWQEPLLQLYDHRPDFIVPDSRRNEVISFVRMGLTDLSVSRTTFTWGISVPGDADHVMYVWLDALTNYITAAGYPDTTGHTFTRYWPADLHMVGKDIVRFHTVYWPALLMAAGLDLPKRVFAHGWWTNEGIKISKSLKNSIDPIELVKQYGLDSVRYFLLREIPFGNDGNFSHRAMVNRINGELANELGNLAQRVLSFIRRYCTARVPEPGPRTASDDELLVAAYQLLEQVRLAIERQAFHEALDIIWGVVRRSNIYVDRQAPWILRRTDPKRMATVLYILAETLRHLALMMVPFLPCSAACLLDQLAIIADARTFAALGPDGALTPGTLLPKPHGIFPRLAMTPSLKG
ncbi:Methionyl-tRNA synthetase [invertebrate metagenome]|uniref:methionine--tRNA ligase n=1 Tax=invertebrate metagenome TaxID=1711999 RepID=A0A484H4F4_9ZZZZ